MLAADVIFGLHLQFELLYQHNFRFLTYVGVVVICGTIAANSNTQGLRQPNIVSSNRLSGRQFALASQKKNTCSEQAYHSNK